MLKERDKKLLFYSWSYGILASALIYCCLGSGAMAYTLLSEATCPTGTGTGTFTSASSWIGAGNLANVSKIEVTGVTHWRLHGDSTGTETVSMCHDGTRLGTGTLTWDFPNSGSYGGSGSATLAWEQGFSVPENHQVTLYTSDSACTGNLDDLIHVAYKGRSSCPTGLYHWYLSGDGNELGGTHKVYSGSALPDAPVINDFTKDATCYAPAEAIVLESNVTGTVDSWLWEIYDDDDVQVWSSTDSVETIVDENFAPGLYQVQLYVENTGGNDFLSKDNWLNITQAGGCLPLQNWSPFPTQTVTAEPTEVVFPLVTMPPIANPNMTGINDMLNQSMLGNASLGYRTYIDLFANGVNSTFVGVISVVISPIGIIISAVANVLSLFSTAMNSLTVYTTVPLAITAKVINAMPWQIVTLITAGIAIDAILIVLLGR